MPQLAILPLLTALAGVAAAGTGIYSAVESKNAASDAANAQKKAQQDALAKQAQQQALQNQKLIAGNLPGAVSQTGGYLTNLGDLGLAGAQSGLPGAPFTGYGQGALGQFMGQGQTPSEMSGISSPGATGPTGALAMLSQLGQGQQGEQPGMMQQTYGISGASV